MNTFKGYRLVFERDQFDSKLRSYYLPDGFRIHDKLDCFNIKTGFAYEVAISVSKYNSWHLRKELG